MFRSCLQLFEMSGQGFPMGVYCYITLFDNCSYVGLFQKNIKASVQFKRIGDSLSPVLRRKARYSKINLY